jgi:hypothetical protein
VRIAELDAKRTGVALELFNRVLTIDPANDGVLAEMDRLTRRRRVLRGVVVLGGIGVMVGGTLLALHVASTERAVQRATMMDPRIASAMAMPPDAAPISAPVAVISKPDAGTRVMVPPPITVASTRPALVIASAQKARRFEIQVNISNVTVRIGDASPMPIEKRSYAFDLPVGQAQRLLLSNPRTTDYPIDIGVAEPGHVINAVLSYKTAMLHIHCATTKNFSVDGGNASADYPVTFQDSQRELSVDFLMADDKIVTKTVTMYAGQDRDIDCSAP